MAFYSYIFTANYKRFSKNLKMISKKYHKSYIGMMFDTVYSVKKYGIGLTDYLNYQFYLKTKEERKEYAGIKIQNTFYETVSPSQYKERYTIKPRFLKEFSKYTKRDFLVPDGNNKDEFLKYIKGKDYFMSKPYDGLGGADVTKVCVKDIKDLDEYYQYICENHLFLEDLVKQHDDLNKLCSASVNTIRIMTFNDHGTPHILWAGLRIGNGINSVDNFHAGGMASVIDLNSGKLINPAIDKDLNEYEYHPKTKTKIVGFKVPYFKEVKEMVKKAALESDKILVVGWDVAITPDGPLIIEGNRRPGFDVVQVASRRGRMDIIRDVLSRVDQNEKK